MFHPIGSKPTVCTFAHTPKLILTGHESGKVSLFDAETGDEVQSNERAHGDVVTDLQISPDRSYFITSSKDKMSRVRRTLVVGAAATDLRLPFQLHDTRTLRVLKTYATETPLNSAAIAPLRPYVRRHFLISIIFLTSPFVAALDQVLLGGGQEAMNVTTTSMRQGKFETRFWHKVFEEEVGRVKGHFGPINTYVIFVGHSTLSPRPFLCTF